MQERRKMGLEFVRGNNARCPPFLVGGLMVMCLFLLCSWWSLSSQNFELLRQIDNLAEQLKVNGEELNKCADQKSALEEKVKDFQNRYNQQRVKLDQIKDEEQENNQKWERKEEEIKNLRNEINSKKADIEMCHTEKESLKRLGESKDKTLDTLRTDVEQKKAHIKELEETVNKLNKNQQEKNSGGVAQLLYNKLKNKDDNKNDKPQDNAGENLQEDGPANGGNHELENLQDEHNVQDSKNDADAALDVPLPLDPKMEKDPRENLMKPT